VNPLHSDREEDVSSCLQNTSTYIEQLVRGHHPPEPGHKNTVYVRSVAGMAVGRWYKHPSRGCGRNQRDQ